MNKRISKIVLGLVISTMVVTSAGLVFMNKDKSQVIDIYGKRQGLGDVSIVYQERQGYYKTKEVVVDKDKLKVDEFAKETPSSYSRSNFVKEHRDLLLHTYKGYTNLYIDDESMGYVEVMPDYSYITEENEKVQYISYVNEKKLDNNKIKQYEVPLDLYERNDSNLEYTVIPIKYKDELYMVIAYDLNLDYMQNGKKVDENFDDSTYQINENSVYGTSESYISVFKLDIETQSSEHIFTKDIGGEEELTYKSRNVSFVYNDTAYVLNYTYKINEEKKYERQISLLTYNVATQKFEVIELPLDIDNDHSIQQYTLENNILTMIATGEDKYGSTHFYLSKINLDTNEIITNSERYDVSIDDSNEFFNTLINDIRLIDNKIYLTIGSYEDTEYTKSVESKDKRYVVVIDEKSKNTLYIGKLQYKTNGYSNPSIVMKDEL